MARGNFPSAKQDQFVLRLPDGMRDELKTVADQNGRSMNAEIIARIEESFEGSERVWDTLNNMAETLEKVQQTLERIAPRVDEMWSRYEGDSIGGRD